MARIRTQTVPWQAGGTLVGFIPPSTPQNATQSALGVQIRHYCDDSLGWPIPHALDIQHIDKSGLNRLNGTLNFGGGGFRTWTAYVPTYFWNTPSGHLSTTLPSTAADITTALARSNPSRPAVSVPNFVYELKDLPGMLRDIFAFKLHLKRLARGEKDPRVLASHYLSYQFGWKPLVSDLQKMCDFAKQTEKVVRRLNSLYSGEGLHRRIERGLGSDVNTSTLNNIFIESAHGTTFICSRSMNTVARRWATVRWKPTSVPKYEAGSKERARQAFAIAYGLNLQPVYLWNAIPWSWLAGWFVNMDDFLSTHSNVVPAISGPVSLMTETKSTAVFRRTDTATAVSGGDGTWIHHSKQRTVGSSGTLLSDFPFLDSRKLSILAALAIQRRVPLS